MTLTDRCLLKTHQRTGAMSNTEIVFSTQIGPYPNLSQETKGGTTVFIDDKMNQRQAFQMDEAKRIVLRKVSNIRIIAPQEVTQLSPDTHSFVIPDLREGLIKSIKGHMIKPGIALPRAIIEAFEYRQLEELPPRSILISLAMHKCHVFLDKSALSDIIKNKILQMSGSIAKGFLPGETVNVVVTNRADSRYSARARKLNIPVVSTQWVEQAYVMSTSYEEEALNHDATKTFQANKIKPFHGLFFKMKAHDVAGHLKTLIVENGGRVAYGISEKVTHIVDTKYPDDDLLVEPRVVDAEFLELCCARGHYLTRTEYREYLSARGFTVKLEPISQSSRSNGHSAFTPPIPNSNSSSSSAYSNDRENRNDENHAMRPPSSNVPRSQARRRCRPSQILSESLDSLAQTQQTQMPSTQIRRMPDNLLPLDSPNESSQQLIWLERGDRTRMAR